MRRSLILLCSAVLLSLLAATCLGCGGEPSMPGQVREALGDPVDVVERLFAAIEDSDTETIVSLTTPELRKELENTYLGELYGSDFRSGLDRVFEALRDSSEVRPPIRFRDLTFDADIKGNKAEVRVTGGYAQTHYVGDYEKDWDFVSEDEFNHQRINYYCPVIIYLENRGGKWLVSGSSLMDYLDEFRHSFEEFEEYMTE